MHFIDFVYRQKLGTAVGTKPTYATLVLGFLEDFEGKIIYKCHGDDMKIAIFIIWDRGED